MKTLEWEDNKLKLIDQTKLPDELTYVYCNDYKEVIVAIKDMIVRGAPAIGVAAAFGMALADLHGEDLDNAADEIKAARPLLSSQEIIWVPPNSRKPKSSGLRSCRRMSFSLCSRPIMVSTNNSQ